MTGYEAWLHKAESDLKSAQKLLAGDDPIMDTAIYHTQQCAEKALKGYLAFQKQPIKKSHDIELLVELCSQFDNEFESLYDLSENLTPYATAFRYPDIYLEPDYDEVYEAIEMAREILVFVRGKVGFIPKKNL
ncbi:MAG TPA: HEPN domain-containing protein [Campylobacterales bacterium]|nr:HEPN domain-containing protein [Campylobacterales bacterium]